jgi:DNA-binding NarL/FixJ family response regulator
MSIAVAIVEDNAGMRGSFSLLLDQGPGIRCVGAYASAEDALREIPRRPPDVLLMDVNLPGMSGIACVARLKAALPQLQVLMLTRFEQSDTIFDALRAGASGYLLKNTPPEEILRAIEQVQAGGAPMSMQIARKVIAHFQRIPAPATDMEKLTGREQEVLGLLAQGYLYKEIGDALGISINTLRNHLRAIYEKLHVHSRTEATVRYLGAS